MRIVIVIIFLTASLLSSAQTQVDSLEKDFYIKGTLKVSKNMIVDVGDGTNGLLADFPVLTDLAVRDSASKIHSAYTFYAAGIPSGLKIFKDEKNYSSYQWYESGELRSRSFYQNGKLTHLVLLHDNGQPEGKFKIVDGEIEGHVTWYNENGTKESEGFYQKGKRVGNWKYYNKKGRNPKVKHH